MKVLQSGRSMIEMLGVLAIVGVLSVGGLTVYAQAMHKYKVYKVTSQVIDTIQQVRKFYSGAHVYDTLEVYTHKPALNITAFEYEADTDTLHHAIGGRVRVSECSRATNGDNEAFCIVLSDLDRKACADLLAENWYGNLVAIGAIAGGDFVETDVMDSAANKGQVVTENNKLIAYNGAIPINLSEIANVCASAGNTLFFKVK